jgi:dihydrofolate synthase/folylpolyglutamate synthase
VSYQEALDYLTSLGRFGIKLGLSRTEALLHEMGDPHRLFQGVHVGGTNGKGSVCAMLAAVLQKAGYRVGLMPKPHLVAYTERIQVDQRPISEVDFAALITELQPVIAGVSASLGPPTEFEILTTAAIYYLARAGIDLLVCEVGLGGRLDSTNVLDLGVSVITNVALDHTQHLGSTLEAIAAEKAGILKPGAFAVTGAQPPALAVIETAAATHNDPLWRLDREIRVSAQDRDWSGLVVTVETPAGTQPELRLPLLGMHQAENAALAVAAIDALRSRGWEVPAGAVRDGLAHTRWPGRLEVIARDPIVLVDGGHNPAGLQRAVEAVQSLAKARPLVVVFGAMKDKDLPAMLALVANLDASAIFTPIDSPRAADPTVLSELYRNNQRVGATSAALPHIATSPTHALALARDLAGPGGVIFVTGSLYLVGEVISATKGISATKATSPSR